ncbi:MAG: hypothetical protein U0822_21400 [Anaerolineae bacterium]
MQFSSLRAPHARYAAAVVLGVAALLALVLSVALADPAKPGAASATTHVPGKVVAKRSGLAPAKARPAAVPAAPGAGAITGHLFANGTPVAGESVALHQYSGASDDEVATTTTDSQGVYTFDNPATPPSGMTYYVLYGPNTDNPSYVGIWYGPDIPNYTAGTTVSGGDIDIANVPLVSPPDGATASLPTTFTWQPRSVATDQYYMDLANPDPPYDGCRYRTSSNSSYTLASLDPVGTCTGFQYDLGYQWFVELEDSTDNTSYGFSYETWNVTFTQTGTPQPSATPSATATVAVPTATATVTPTATNGVPSVTVTPTATGGTPSYPIYLPLISRAVAPPVVTPSAP